MDDHRLEQPGICELLNQAHKVYTSLPPTNDVIKGSGYYIWREKEDTLESELFQPLQYGNKVCINVPGYTREKTWHCLETVPIPYCLIGLHNRRKYVQGLIFHIGKTAVDWYRVYEENTDEIAEIHGLFALSELADKLDS